MSEVNQFNLKEKTEDKDQKKTDEDKKEQDKKELNQQDKKEEKKELMFRRLAVFGATGIFSPTATPCLT